MDPVDLASALCERLNQELPAEVHVREHRGHLEFLRGGDVQEQLSFVEHFDSETSWQETAESVIWNALDKLQDFMIEVMGRNTWPAQCGFGGLAQVSTTSDEIEFWYGDAANPSLRFAPIRIVDAM